MTILFIILILVLGFIGYQLYERNELKRIEMVKKEEDELLKQKFPHIFLEYRDSVRKFWRGIKDKEAYFDRYSKYSAFDPRDYKNLADWTDINSKIREKIGYVDLKYMKPDAKENLEKYIGKEDAKKWRALEKIEKLQKEILNKEIKRREVTKEEISYVLYMFWKKILEEEELRGLDDSEFSLSLYMGWLERLLALFPKKPKVEEK